MPSVHFVSKTGRPIARTVISRPSFAVCHLANALNRPMIKNHPVSCPRKTRKKRASKTKHKNKSRRKPSHATRKAQTSGRLCASTSNGSANVLDVVDGRFAKIDGRFAKLETSLLSSGGRGDANHDTALRDGVSTLCDAMVIVTDRLLSIEGALKKDLSAEVAWRTDQSKALVTRLGGLEDVLLAQSQKIDSVAGGVDFSGTLQALRKDLGMMSGELINAVAEGAVKPVNEAVLADSLRVALAPAVAAEVNAVLVEKLAPMIQEAVAGEIKRASRHHQAQLESVEKAIETASKRSIEAANKQLAETTTKIEAKMKALVPDIAKMREFTKKFEEDLSATCEKLEDRLEEISNDSQQLGDMIESSNNTFVSGFSIVKGQIPALIDSIKRTADTAEAVLSSADIIARAMLEVIKMTSERNSIPIEAVRTRSEAIMQRVNDALDSREDFRGKVSALGGGLIKPLTEHEIRPVVLPPRDVGDEEDAEEESS